MADEIRPACHAGRPDLAAAHLKGKVDAPRFAEGEKFSIGAGRTALARAPDRRCRRRTANLLFGETFTVYDRANGWAWGQAANDLYVGYVRESALMAPFVAEANVTALMAPVFAAADLKTPVRDLLPMNAAVPVMGRQGDYVKIADGAWLHQRHLEPLGRKRILWPWPSAFSACPMSGAARPRRGWIVPA